MVQLFSTIALLLPALANAQYQVVKEYAGASFFNDWDFYNHYDNLTNGNVKQVYFPVKHLFDHS
ncbi:hypothetical protein AcV7_004872 [Taiwanofungus camphoratus]|nr:hypothetical protein AcV7_004872 [Antrodia cinnamomea]